LHIAIYGEFPIAAALLPYADTKAVALVPNPFKAN
jgi:hypothetical protein